MPGRRHLSVRGRIVGWSILLLTFSMLATTEATHLLSVRRSDATISRELSHEVDEFNAVPSPGSARSPVAVRMAEAIDGVVSSSDVMKFALLDGRLVAHSTNSAVQSSGPDAQVLARLSRLTLPARGTIALKAGAMRYVAISVRATGDSSTGTFVVAIPLAPQRAAVWAATRLQLEVGAGSLALAFALAWLAAGRVLRPIRRTTNLAERITATDLNERLPVQGHDELSSLAASFNGMLDRLQETLAEQRRFLADAGHELRTPITIIQGNLDTLSIDDAEDRDTLAIVSDELDRMARLVNELLILGSSQRPDFLRLSPTNLAQLATSLGTKAQALGRVDWSVRSTLSGSALLDAQRVTQAVMQLVANALAHNPSGAATELVFSEDGTDLTLAVVDHGRGVPVQDRGRIFDRFARVDRQHDNSTGLGLSIVVAIATAHGGSVGVADTPGGGATFTLRLPRRSTASQPELTTASSTGTER